MLEQRPTRPLSLDESSRLVVARSGESAFQSDGLRGDVSYWNLGLDAASAGRVGVQMNRATAPFEHETGWHWHDLTLHVVYVVRGSLTFRFRGLDEPVVLGAGDVISQPPGVPHNVVARSDDLEVLEITMPAEYGTYDLAGPDAPGARASERDIPDDRAHGPGALDDDLDHDMDGPDGP